MRPGSTVAGPEPNSQARRKAGAMRSARISAWNGPVPWRAQEAMVTMWSCRFAPTPGESTTGAMPCSLRWSAGPMPDSIRRCGELNTPPARITSRAARSSCVRPSLRYSIPTARVPSIITRVASAPVISVTFGRASAGRRKARAALHRRPLRMVDWPREMPSCSAPL